MEIIKLEVKVQCSIHLHSWIKGRPLRKLLNISWQYDARFSTIAYIYNAMIHLNRRVLDSWLLLKNDTIVTIWGQGGRKWKGMYEEKSLYLQNHIMENNKKYKHTVSAFSFVPPVSSCTLSFCVIYHDSLLFSVHGCSIFCFICVCRTHSSSLKTAFIKSLPSSLTLNSSLFFLFQVQSYLLTYKTTQHVSPI